MRRTVHLLVPSCDEDKSFWRDTAIVIGHVYLLTERQLSFLDGHPLGYANIDMYFLTCRILYAQHLILPVGIGIFVDGQSLLYGFLHQRLVIYIHTRHKRECLGQNILLGAVVVTECSVVRTDVRQLLLQFLVASSDIADHFPEPVFGEQPVQLLRSPRLCIPAILIACML